ncbi:uncharacterized protein AMSG_09766 [Thecamonas trahens ATCC 50062]|uniref:Uncharacterized protein n=1 Tax=Thecamonas trahens ATCC 50062 TaxID=461836 RepID=A0A0L0DND7_THETB|nr:hypothetical protein AMSG_09766 [Thecamonas trahens ATCC 50062]KNC53824.1 hypothetical protein AMSG_09766 [Thecamonas trahens ATCC 50062]|eukprot:XP_013754209.1 hypothetical protein AMSG_09766 [Thecamonas trahens ATCC 50062]
MSLGIFRPVAWSVSEDGGEAKLAETPVESSAEQGVGEAAAGGGEETAGTGGGEKKKRARLRRVRRKKKPMPFVIGVEEASMLYEPCSHRYAAKWPLTLICRREPAFPFFTTLEQREKGCVMFYRRYLELLEIDGHSTERAVGAWTLYDNCMKAPLPPHDAI